MIQAEAETADQEDPPEAKERGEVSIEMRNFLDEREKTDRFKSR